MTKQILAAPVAVAVLLGGMFPTAALAGDPVADLQARMARAEARIDYLTECLCASEREKTEASEALAALQGEVRSLRRKLTEQGALTATLNLQLGQHAEKLVALTGRVDDLETRVTAVEGRVTGVETRVTAVETTVHALDVGFAGHEQRIGGLEGGLADVVARVDASEDRERAWREGLLIGFDGGYAGDIGGESKEFGIFYEDGSQYAPSRFSVSPYIGIVAEYRERLYTDFTVGFVGDITNSGIGVRFRGKIGGLLLDRRLVLGGTAFAEFTKAGGGDGGTYNVTGTHVGGGVFAKGAIWRSAEEAAQLYLGVELAVEADTSAILTDRLSFTSFRGNALLELRLGKPLPPRR